MPAHSGVVGLTEVARRANVAVSTASRALRNSPEIHPSTRERILQEAKALGYIPHNRNRDKTPPPQALQLLVLTAGDETPKSYMTELSRAALQRDIALQFHNCSSSEAHRLLDPDKLPVSLRMGMAVGIVLILRWPREVVEKISSQFPTVSLINSYPGLPVDTVGLEETTGMFDLVALLKSKGHKQIGFYGLCPSLTWSRSRYAAYINAAIAHDLPSRANQEVRLELDPDTNSMVAGSPAILDHVASEIRKGVCAWVTPDERVGYNLCAGLMRRGFSVPGDVSITSFHRHPNPPSDLPLLTSVSIDVAELTSIALSRILRRKQNPGQPPLAIQISCPLAPGESVGICPARA